MKREWKKPIRTTMGCRIPILLLAWLVMTGGAGDIMRETVAAEPEAGEQKHIEVLQSDADAEDKKQACRALKKVGTVKAVPSLAALLDRPELSHMARYALESMPAPEAGTALIQALDRTSGEIKVGIINSLGRRGETGAVDELSGLLDQSDAGVVSAAAAALGTIGTVEAAQVLRESVSAADGDRAVALADGCLRAAQQLREDGKTDAAAELYRMLRAERWPRRIRLAAFVGLVKAGTANTASLLVEGFGSDDELFRGHAARLVHRDVSVGVVKKVVAARADIPVNGQTRLLDALASRGGSAGRGAAREALMADAKAIRLAGVRALGSVGTADDVEGLVELLNADTDEVRSAAAAALRRVEGRDVSRAIADALDGAEPGTRVMLVRILVDRRAPGALPEIVDALDSSSQKLQMTALRGLREMAGPDQVRVIVGRLRSGSEEERELAESALLAVCRRAGDNAEAAVLKALEAAQEPGVRPALLQALGAVGTDAALHRVRSAVDSDDEQVRDTAVRVLSGWESSRAAPVLLELARDTQHDTHRILCLRGFVRLARETPIAERIQMLTRAGDVARTAGVRKLIISAWGSTPAPEALRALVDYLQDSAVRTEAAAAIVGVAEQLSDDHPDAVKGAMEAVLEVLETGTFRERAKKLLNEVEAK